VIKSIKIVTNNTPSSSPKIGIFNNQIMERPSATPGATPAPAIQQAISLESISPNLFDIVPPTERLLSRILLPSGDPTTDTSSLPENKRPLDISHLDAAANPIRVKFTKLRSQLPQLPDMDRTVEEQQEEIDELELRITKQKAMLGNIKAIMAKDVQ